MSRHAARRHWQFPYVYKEIKLLTIDVTEIYLIARQAFLTCRDNNDIGPDPHGGDS